MGSRLNTTFLAGVARHYLRWPVVVRIMPGDGFSADLDYVGEHWQINLYGSPVMGQLATTFFHEIAHALLGHMTKKDTGRGPGVSPEEYHRLYPGEKGEHLARWAQEREDAATACGLRLLQLYERLNGIGTFERYAITRGDDHD